MWFIYVMDIKNFADKWTELENIILSEVIQFKIVKDGMYSLT